MGLIAVLHLSEILLQNHDIESFLDVVEKVREGARGERFFRMDIRPPFPDTPENWEFVLEAAFSSVIEPAGTST